MKKGLIIFCMLFFINFISAVPPVTTVQNFPEGLLLIGQQQEIITLNHNYTYHFFVSNSSTGTPIDNSSVNCYFFMANKYGEIILSTIATYLSDTYWEVFINETYFDELGEYPYGLRCVDGIGGVLSGTFYVTSDGKENSIQIILVDILLLLTISIIIFMISMKHSNTDFESWDKNIIKNNKNMGQTFINSLIYTIFKNTFIWIYFIGWLFVMVLNHLVGKFSSTEVYGYFTLIANVYSLGLILVTIYFIGLFASYMKKNIEILTEKNWGTY